MEEVMKRIYFIASFGNFCKLPIGGGQTAARRLLSTLRGLNYDVVTIRRHSTSKIRFIRGFQFVFWLFVDSLYVFFRLLFSSRKNTITLYMGYLGGVLVPLEYIMSIITRILGYKNVMYLAGGGTDKMYNNSNSISRFLVRKTLDNYKLVMIEGLENIAFVKSLTRAETFYLPNYTEHTFAPESYPQKPQEQWNLIYFGRISAVKNVTLVIDAFNILSSKYKNMTLTIVGGGDEEYCLQVEDRIRRSPYADKIMRINRINHDVLKQLLIDKHFFVFPSSEPREGHSNALNEAMSFGIVPIVSNNNFLPSIVDDKRLVVLLMDAGAYADAVSTIIESGEFEALSVKMYKRVQCNFTQSIVERSLFSLLESV